MTYCLSLIHILERQDSLSIQEMKISVMGYIKDEYTINRNFNLSLIHISEFLYTFVQGDTYKVPDTGTYRLYLGRKPFGI